MKKFILFATLTLVWTHSPNAEAIAPCGAGSQFHTAANSIPAAALSCAGASGVCATAESMGPLQEEVIFSLSAQEEDMPSSVIEIAPGYYIDSYDVLKKSLGSGVTVFHVAAMTILFGAGLLIFFGIIRTKAAVIVRPARNLEARACMAEVDAFLDDSALEAKFRELEQRVS